VWRDDGRELYYVSPGNRLMAAGISATGTAAPALELFQAPLFSSLFAPSREGSRFLIAIPAPSTEVVPMEIQLNALAR
jgi:hypothetical protein